MKHPKEKGNISIEKGIRSKVRCRSSAHFQPIWVTDGHTDIQTGPILYPRPLTQEGISTSLKILFSSKHERFYMALGWGHTVEETKMQNMAQVGSTG